MVRTGSSTAEPPPFKRKNAGSIPARCNRGSVAQRQRRLTQNQVGRSPVQVRILPEPCNGCGSSTGSERGSPKAEAEGSIPSRNMRISDCPERAKRAERARRLMAGLLACNQEMRVQLPPASTEMNALVAQLRQRRVIESHVVAGSSPAQSTVNRTPR
jgi:hypothetical protein